MVEEEADTFVYVKNPKNRWWLWREAISRVRTQVLRKGLAVCSEGWLGPEACGFCWQPSATAVVCPAEWCWSHDHALRAVTTKPGAGAGPRLDTTWGICGSIHAGANVWAGGTAGDVKQCNAISPSTWLWPNKPLGFLGKGGYFELFLMEYLKVLAINWGSGRKAMWLNLYPKFLEHTYIWFIYVNFIWQVGSAI